LTLDANRRLCNPQPPIRSDFAEQAACGDRAHPTRTTAALGLVHLQQSVLPRVSGITTHGLGRHAEAPDKRLAHVTPIAKPRLPGNDL
jgi:hypothetical protein